MATRQPLIAGNWKLNGTRSSAVALAADVARGVTSLPVDVLVCPVALHIADVSAALAETAVSVGAQNCSEQTSGAYTGEVAAAMLKEYGCNHVIVGHSERRALFHETSEQVAAKCLAVQAAGMTPILCVGETLEEREEGRVEAVIAEQLDAVISAGGIEAFSRMVVAYEPVWAIGTGKTATPEEAQAVHAMIRGRLATHSTAVADSLRILYGGSVKPDNAASLFGQADIDGGLIGGASLDADSFVAICKAAASLTESSAS